MPDNPTSAENSQDYKLIPLSGKRGEGKFAIVDADVYEELSRYKWRLLKDYVARSERANGSHKTILIHRQIMNSPVGMDTDHRNGNKLDNRRENLRICTTAQNVVNRRKTSSLTSSQFAGVSFDKSTGKWKATIGFNKRQINLGLFDSEEYAARVRDGATIVLFGEFAPPRNLPNQEPIPYSHREKLPQSSKYKGVSFRPDCDKWQAFYCFDYKTILVGYYLTELDAARARDGALITRFGLQAERQVIDHDPIFQKPAEYYGLRSSKFFGVSWHKNQKKWNVIIPIGKKQKYVGSFTDEIEAAHAYDKAVKLLFGEVEKLNFKE